MKLERLFEVAAIEGKEIVGIAGDGKGADVDVVEVSRQGGEVEIVRDRGNVNATVGELATHMTYPGFGDLN